ncbi:hypothetical protein DYB28_015948 [Aphanomyces astaci]|uniref:Sushi domain-containing protein n=1 Tax=Aphanomyces astaci TaxID=112090 RepID=A0A397C592_APHAT|nr:hypothetical protein DYB36_000427 [Aphanomyces astaci]RHY17989.1 hypothetical protein DYB25_000155 [Aphanomyces astaci]RHY37134.1 hypothetical protein DYB38_012457 [Aphanomyces astaci]RHY39952.1 hypothetical protein DYB30_004424 [Aphanomyces astaci]RHY78101.1 hypothetical protein DYB34_013147 [Aphanomyces astaci]
MMMIRAVARTRPATAKLVRGFSAAAQPEDDSALMQQIKEETLARSHSVLPPHASDDQAPSLVEPIQYPEECALVSGVGEWTKGRKAVLYKPARNQMQSTKAFTHHWELRFGTSANWQNPLMGWNSGADPVADLVVKFDTKEDAFAVAKRQGWTVEVFEPKEEEDFEGKIAYSHNFLPLHVENQLKKYGKKATPIFKHPTGGHSHWVKTLKYHGNGDVAQHAHRMTCPALHNIANGSVQITGSAAGATASYSCQTNYAMTGTSSRTCKHGAWSGSEPRCRVVYSRDSDNSFKAGHKGYKIGMK